MRPTIRTLYLLALIGLIALINACLAIPAQDLKPFENFSYSLWQVSILLFSLLLLFDALLLFSRPAPGFIRIHTDILPVGHWSEITLKWANKSSILQRFSFLDHTPNSVELDLQNATLTLKPNTELTTSYRIRPKQRGKIIIGPMQLLINSPLGLWERSIKLAQVDNAKVYPDFASVQHFALLLQENLQGQSGIKLLHRRGEGQDFHQLREYRQGDSLRQLDWKATARVHKLISREYQDERDQTLFFVLDSGRRMRTKDGELSHFDHALNALLLLSFVALKQGDSIGLIAFGGNSRFLAPIKGSHKINSLLNAVYDLHSTTEASDYRAATLEIMQRIKKRSLILFITNIRSENFQEVLHSVNLLKRNHLVLIANLQESILEQTRTQLPENLDQALAWVEIQDYLAAQANNDEELKKHAIVNVRTTPINLPAVLINSYWEIKRAGKL